MNLADLAAELNKDPLNLGYAFYLGVGCDTSLADLLNSKTGIGVATINLKSISRQDMLLGLVPALVSLPSKDSATQAKWDRVLYVVESVDIIDLTQPNNISLLTAAIADGILTQDQVNAFTQRIGSRAEVLFGQDTIISYDQIAAALR